MRVSHAVTDHHDVHEGKLVVRGHLDDELNVVIGKDEHFQKSETAELWHIVLLVPWW